MYKEVIINYSKLSPVILQTLYIQPKEFFQLFSRYVALHYSM